MALIDMKCHAELIVNTLDVHMKRQTVGSPALVLYTKCKEKNF